MKKILAVLVFLPGILFGQYWGERSTEQSFEMSELYFTSHYLNTFALLDFRKVAPGLMDDPFMNLYINPANLPARDTTSLFYLDFRGDRTAAPIVNNYTYPAVMYSDVYLRPYIDPRWISIARSEPEPVVSAGMLTYPLQGTLDNLFIGATYQFLYKQEKYYELPYWIYNSRYMVDAFGMKASADFRDVPVIDRQNGNDKMLTKGHLFSVFAGYRISENLSLGASINGVIHSRDGQYGNSNQSEYGNTSTSKYSSMFSQDRNEDYHHVDYSAGAAFRVNRKLSLGVKAGILDGKADQDYSKGNSYSSTYNTPGEGPNWSYNFSNSLTSQVWNNNGKTKYAGFNFRYAGSSVTEVTGYYRYSQTDIDLTNSSVITDTMYYSSKYTDNQNLIHLYNGQSGTEDIRLGSGSRNYHINEAMVRVKWNLSSISTVNVGFYFNITDKKSTSIEPARVRRNSQYFSSYPGSQDYNYLNLLNEIKTLEWVHRDQSFTFQIPVLLNLKLTEVFNVKFAINRIFRTWEISDQTTAYFTSRKRNEQGVIKEEKNFGERYKQPTETISETDTDIAGGVDINVSPQLQINLLLDPEFQNGLGISQWWVGFRAAL